MLTACLRNEEAHGGRGSRGKGREGQEVMRRGREGQIKQTVYIGVKTHAI